MNNYILVIISMTGSILASSGFWLYLQNHLDKRDTTKQILLGLCHDRIIRHGRYYITRGWLTDEEYSILYNNLWKPYEAMGGNGSGKKMMQEIDKLPIKRYSDLEREGAV